MILNNYREWQSENGENDMCLFVKFGQIQHSTNTLVESSQLECMMSEFTEFFEFGLPNIIIVSHED